MEFARGLREAINFCREVGGLVERRGTAAHEQSRYSFLWSWWFLLITQQLPDLSAWLCIRYKYLLFQSRAKLVLLSNGFDLLLWRFTERLNFSRNIPTVTQVCCHQICYSGVKFKWANCDLFSFVIVCFFTVVTAKQKYEQSQVGTFRNGGQEKGRTELGKQWKRMKSKHKKRQ